MSTISSRPTASASLGLEHRRRRPHQGVGGLVDTQRRYLPSLRALKTPRRSLAGAFFSRPALRRPSSSSFTASAQPTSTPIASAARDVLIGEDEDLHPSAPDDRD